MGSIGWYAPSAGKCPINTIPSPPARVKRGLNVLKSSLKKVLTPKDSRASLMETLLAFPSRNPL
eukprot:4504158-Pyramimonas_sp.AAC.1